jgi:phosphate transport system permease protein
MQRHGTAVVAIAPSPRGRTFATADAAGAIRFHHATTHRTLAIAEPGRRSGAPPSTVRLTNLAFSPRGTTLIAGGTSGQSAWSLQAPHPEASAAAFFGPLWYEGYVEPKHVWQSTGGSDEFEPKLGLVPLLVGTLKGTLYALLFSVPIAVLAALYVSQLASPALRATVKPAIELMAAMPSVVVGFLAALWLAPLLETHLGAALGAVIVIPFGLLLAVAAWYLVPRTLRQRAHPGVELAFLIPFLVGAAWTGAQLGGPIEASLFGGDLRQWLFDHHGITYDQRNCIVVGIALGFAIIPVIFTISEDAMSAVPRSLSSGALALGASRWQSALHVVLPAASPGIFAAVMLGLGRAIGETMIVLMATGNTPILDLSPFNGMRTMSASIAVEIPEAPHGGTLYRVLFLTGSLLFVFTFLLNTAADSVSRRLRKRYGQF